MDVLTLFAEYVFALELEVNKNDYLASFVESQGTFHEQKSQGFSEECSFDLENLELEVQESRSQKFGLDEDNLAQRLKEAPPTIYEESKEYYDETCNNSCIT